MDEVIRNLSGPQLIGFTAVIVGTVGVTIISVVGAVAPHWKRVRQVEAELQLKRDLVAAGFSADEIERVVRATSAPARRTDRPASRVG